MELPQSKTGSTISPLWAAEFCGLFWGEGMLSLHRVSRVRQGKRNHLRTVDGPFYRSEAIMALRADDEAVLREIEFVLGGHVAKRPGVIEKNQSPQLRWVTTSLEDSLRVGLVLSHGFLPAKKKLELPLWLESIQIRAGRGKKLTQEQKDRLDFLYHQIHLVRAYSLDKVQILQSERSSLSLSLT